MKKNYNGILEFAKMMFKANFKDTKLYIILTTITIAIIFNMINISYNSMEATKDVTFSKETYADVIDYRREEPIVLGEVEVDLKVMQQQNLLVIIIVTILFAAICNVNYIKKKSKEIAFIITNGASLIDVMKYLTYSTGRCYLIALAIGIPIGIGLIPVFNIINYAIQGTWGPIFNISLPGLAISLVYILMQFITLMILNMGYVARSEVITLMKAKNTFSYSDTRIIRLPGFLFVLLYIGIAAFLIYSTQLEGGYVISNLANYLGIAAIYGMVRYFLPKYINKLKKKKFMYKGLRSIYASNFVATLEKSVIYIMALVFVFNYYTYVIVEFKDYQGMKEMSIFCIVVACLMIGFSLVYKLLVDIDDKLYLYKQLEVLGYDRDHILKIQSKESLWVFLFMLVLPLLLIGLGLVNYIAHGVYTVSLSVGIILLITVSLLVCWVVSMKLNKRKLDDVLFNNSGN